MTEHGFFHHDIGYWQTNSAPGPEILASYPDGTVEVPLCPGQGWNWSGSEWIQSGPSHADVPTSVSRFQARAALHLAGLLDDAEAAVAAADRLTQLAWTDARDFRRDSPTIAALAIVLGLDDQAIDDLFRQAATITA
ncbi:hypothetical protein ACTTAI_19145 [Rhodobacter capsulatus]|uniref:hypothetical protein n=1 Tax=Rhodobacter capsulatus TaxID=1061 RepID=UPI004025AB42